MKTYQFKTTINCGGCVAKVTPHLNAEANIKSWEVDTNNPEKVLTVETEKLEPAEIKAMVEKLGFKAEAL
jgi:copper chaperone